MILNKLIGPEQPEKQRKLAIKYYKQAAKQDHPDAMYELALIYEKDVMNTKDRKYFDRAFSLYQKSADKYHNPKA